MRNRNKYNKTSEKKRWIIVLSCTALLVVAGLFLWFFVVKDNYPIGAEMNRPEQQAADTNGKKDFIDNPEAGSSNPDAPLSNGNTDASKVVLVTRQESDMVVVSTKLYEYSDGTCSLKVTNNSKVYTKSAPIIFQPEYSTCAGFSISREELGAGKWIIELTAQSKGESVTKTITMDVS